MSDPQVFVGIDVSKAQLDVALRPTEDHWHVSNDEVGIPGLVERLQAIAAEVTTSTAATMLVRFLVANFPARYAKLSGRADTGRPDR